MRKSAASQSSTRKTGRRCIAVSVATAVSRSTGRRSQRTTAGRSSGRCRFPARRRSRLRAAAQRRVAAGRAVARLVVAQVERLFAAGDHDVDRSDGRKGDQQHQPARRRRERGRGTVRERASERRTPAETQEGGSAGRTSRERRRTAGSRAGQPRRTCGGNGSSVPGERSAASCTLRRAASATTIAMSARPIAAVSPRMRCAEVDADVRPDVRDGKEVAEGPVARREGTAVQPPLEKGERASRRHEACRERHEAPRSRRSTAWRWPAVDNCRQRSDERKQVRAREQRKARSSAGGHRRAGFRREAPAAARASTTPRAGTSLIGWTSWNRKIGLVASSTAAVSPARRECSRAPRR